VKRMQLMANLVNSHTPEVTACAAISPSVLPACLSLIVKRALVFEVSLLEMLWKNGNFKF